MESARVPAIGGDDGPSSRVSSSTESGLDLVRMDSEQDGKYGHQNLEVNI